MGEGGKRDGGFPRFILDVYTLAKNEICLLVRQKYLPRGHIWTWMTELHTDSKYGCFQQCYVQVQVLASELEHNFHICFVNWYPQPTEELN